MHDLPARRRPLGTPCGTARRAEADAFDLWLTGSLREAFDAVAAEPIPPDLLRMIEEDRAERERLRRKRQGSAPGR
jgi:hypothetical protein